MDKVTKQFKKRNAILTCLQQTDCHPSAEMVHEMLHQEHLISKQERERRREKMKKEFLGGLTVADLSDKYKLSGARICQLLKEKGVSVREVMNARKRRPA